MIESAQIVGIIGYLERFRKHLVAMVVLLVLVTCFIYAQTNWIMGILTSPAHKIPLFYITPVEGFLTKLKVSIAIGFMLCFPIFIYIIMSFISKKFSFWKRFLMYVIVLPFATLCFWGGIVFGYFLLLPTTISFLLSCGNEFMKPMISGSSFVSFMFFFLIGLGLIFELPLILVTLSRFGIIKYVHLAKNRKYAILGIFVILAILTPTPDAFTLIMVSTPMVFLYELSIWWIFLLEKKKKKVRTID